MKLHNRVYPETLRKTAKHLLILELFQRAKEKNKYRCFFYETSQPCISYTIYLLQLHSYSPSDTTWASKIDNLYFAPSDVLILD